jgi:hypothetical protein
MLQEFGAAEKLSVVTEDLHRLPPVAIIRLRNMTALDATGLFALEEVAKQLHASQRTLILCGRPRTTFTASKPNLRTSSAARTSAKTCRKPYDARRK